MEVTTKTKVASVVLIAFICTLFIRFFIIEGFIVMGDSMAPAINSGDYVFINKLAYWGKKEPAREDIVVAIPRTYPNKVIKRIIALPGERFRIENNKVVISEGRTDPGTILTEIYLESSTTPAVGTTLIQLDPEEYFALGDNRQASIDSRELGPLDKWDIKGRVIGKIDFKNFKYVDF